ncbi:MAG: hypothetical protein PF436_08375 [Prolixibacteraceae bacterium]|jgi:hypothetical protein|nr:hypothetical protein [Prolixibacteraceae bacterium]
MKKLLQSTISIILALVLFGTQSFAFTITASINSASEIEAAVGLDESDIYAAFDEIEDLISVIDDNQDLTYSELESLNSELTSNISSSAAIAMNASAADTPPFIGAFLWGCIFNWVGMLIVGITTGFDGTQLRKSAWGCLVGSLLWSGGYLATY